MFHRRAAMQAKQAAQTKFQNTLFSQQQRRMTDRMFIYPSVSISNL